MDDLCDDALMGLARQKTEAFDTLVRRHQQMVYRISVKFLGNATDAKDVTQNSFVELYRYLDRYEPRGRFVSFLGRIVLNQCKMAARSMLSAVAMAKRRSDPKMRSWPARDGSQWNAHSGSSVPSFGRC